jgi:nicotinamide-nucleotide amidase
VLVSLPGVPFEMEYLMSNEVLPRLKSKFVSRPIVHRTLLTAGEGESAIARRLEDFEETLPAHIKLAYLPALARFVCASRASGREKFIPIQSRL